MYHIHACVKNVSYLASSISWDNWISWLADLEQVFETFKSLFSTKTHELIVPHSCEPLLGAPKNTYCGLDLCIYNFNIKISWPLWLVSLSTSLFRLWYVETDVSAILPLRGGEECRDQHSGGDKMMCAIVL